MKPTGHATNTAAAQALHRGVWVKATPEPKTVPVDNVAELTTVKPTDFVEAQRVLLDYSGSTGRPQSAGVKDAQTGAWSRGLLQAKQEHFNQGSLFTIYSGHAGPTDGFASLKFRMRVATPQGQAPQVFDLHDFHTMGVKLASQQGTGAHQHESVLKFYVPDAQLQASMQKAMPNTKIDDLIQNAEFAVAGVWDNGNQTGRWNHTWGDFDRDGIIPFSFSNKPVIKNDMRVVVGLPPNQTKVELDISVPISAAMKKKYPIFDTPKAVFGSHMEAEGKVRVPLSRFKEIYDRMQALAAQTDGANSPDMQAIFGNEAGDWTVERVKKYDPKGVAMVADKHGFLPVNEFNDISLDNAARDGAKHFIVLRIRRVAGEKNNFTQINSKPGPGVRNPINNVARRVEQELIVTADVMRNPDLLLPFLNDKTEPLNPQNMSSAYVQNHTGAPFPASVLGREDLRVTQFSGIGSNRRFKFELANQKTLVGFENSVDLCATMPTDGRGMPIRVDANGKPDANGEYIALSTYGQSEPEANHMAGAVGGASAQPPAAAPNPAPQAVASGPVAAAAGQAAPAAAAVSAPVTYIHGLQDLHGPLFQTDPGYVQFDKVMPAFQQWLFQGKIGARNGAHPTDQKNAMGQRFAGMLPMSNFEQGLYAQELEASRQFRINASKVLMPFVKAAEADIAAAAAKFGTTAPEYLEALAVAREKVWAEFGKLNPLDFVDLTTLPPP
ncbi:MAG: hypothetical protein K1X64_22960 [Myxococcaceae bacterium]|nr:hypothetical protein [Myxococcaceae bacterium]